MIPDAEAAKRERLISRRSLLTSIALVVLTVLFDAKGPGGLYLTIASITMVLAIIAGVVSFGYFISANQHQGED
jgi:hypothetical protein